MKKAVGREDERQEVGCWSCGVGTLMRVWMPVWMWVWAKGEVSQCGDGVSGSPRQVLGRNWKTRGRDCGRRERARSLP